MTKPSPVFQAIRIDSWDEAVKLLRQLPRRWVFRGQSDSDWSLTTTLERAASRLRCAPEARAEREDWIVTEFQRRAHSYLSDLPDPGNRLEWLALLQHHGAPTRLLDFTLSFYIAAFFALESATRDAAVWAIDRDALDAAIARRGGMTFSAISRTQLNGAYIKLCNTAYADGLDCRLSVAVQPERMNDRLAAQQGLFLFPFDLTCTFEDNLAATLGESSFDANPEVPLETWGSHPNADCAVLKIVLSKATHRHAMEDLQLMKVSSETLFPGLDGFVRSLHFHLMPPIADGR